MGLMLYHQISSGMQYDLASQDMRHSRVWRIMVKVGLQRIEYKFPLTKGLEKSS
jgi:hypothetical protein